jgi:SAM-dependent methyltransferase
LSARLPRLVELWRSSRGPKPGSASTQLGAREIQEAGAALLALQRGLTGGRKLAGDSYMEDRDLLGAYLLYYWPVSYLQVSLALAELPLEPARVLDLGSGPGPASAAVIDSLPPGRALEELVLVDGSKRALELGAALLGSGPGSPARLKILELDLETFINERALAASGLSAESFDLIVLGHSLNELWAREGDALERRLTLLERAAALLSPGGSILLIEPALLTTSRALIALRDRLAARSWRVLAPCPGSYSCPAFAAGPERSCHAESPWEPPELVAALAKAAGLDRSSVKFAFFLVAPPGKGRGDQPQPSPALRRVVSEPMLNKAGRLRYLLCGEGRLETLSARTDDPAARAKGFMGLRRGDALSPRGLESRPGGGLGLLPDSELDVQALAPEASR